VPQPAISFNRVWKKFRRGERHDSLRDLVPALVKRALFRPRNPTDLEDQEFWALRDVSFEVMPGEALGIIGPNGAGKSTALKLLTRILRPTSGECHLQGRVGALIEVAAGFHPDLTGRENVYLQGAIMGMRRGEISRKLDEIVEFSGIESFIDTPVKRYSSGMNARLGFSIAAFLDPDVLLIDEVLAVGDFTFQQKCFQRLADFRQAGIAIAFVSHNMQAVATLCDRAMLLRPNQAPLLASVADVTSAYASTSIVSVSDPRVEVLSAALRRSEPGEEALIGPAAPGAALLLDVRVRVTTELPRAGFLFQVVRSDGTIMFTGMSTLDGDPETHFLAGDVARIRTHFSANVLRGTYIINVHFVDSLRVWSTVRLPGIASFVISETTRVEGSAELSPRYKVVRESAAKSLSDEPVRL
jgi:lipopolysaccharide transport system ATP-binding protein